MKTYFLVNPIAGRGRGRKMIEPISEMIKGYPEQFELYVTECRGDATKFAQSIRNTKSVLLCFGGDGTLNEIINGLGAYSEVILSIFPIGSGNDFARSVNQKLSISEIVRKVSDPKFENIDIGQVKFKINGNLTIHYFLNSCGIGFDALSAYYSNQKSILRGLPLYLKAVFNSLVKYQPFFFEAYIDANPKISGLKMMISIGNGKTSGGGFYLTPKAQIADGLLDIAIAEHLNLLKILVLLPRAINGDYINTQYVKYLKFKKASFCIEPGNYIHTDGEVLSKSVKEFEIEIIKSSLKILR